MKPQLLKTNGPFLATLAALFFMAALSRAATIITSVPYIITVPGEYEFVTDVTANGTDGIEIRASNVTLDLKGHTLRQAGTGKSATGTLGANNIVIKNGTIIGFDQGVILTGQQNVAENLHLVHNSIGVQFTGDNGFIQGCLIVGQGGAGVGIVILSGSGVQMINNQISETENGIWVPNGACAIIHNYVANSKTGLNMSSSTKYQGNVTTNCPTPFKGGIAVGQENG